VELMYLLFRVRPRMKCIGGVASAAQAKFRYLLIVVLCNHTPGLKLIVWRNTETDFACRAGESDKSDGGLRLRTVSQSVDPGNDIARSDVPADPSSSRRVVGWDGVQEQAARNSLIYTMSNARRQQVTDVCVVLNRNSIVDI